MCDAAALALATLDPKRFEFTATNAEAARDTQIEALLAELETE